MPKVCVIGSGAREHAIIKTLLKNKSIQHIYVCPGNDGMICQNVSLLNIDVFSCQFEEFCKNNIDLVIPGQEKELVHGITNILKKICIPCFGPSKKASLIEGSKVFSKQMMTQCLIPTAKFQIYEDCSNSIKYLRTHGYENCVIKADGLAGGKGVFLPTSETHAIQIIENMLIKKIFGKAGQKIIIEERLYGQEVSVMGFCNGKEIVLMPQSQDYKRFGDNDIGLNTGGMGSHAPVFVLNSKELSAVKMYMERIVKTLEYVGILYAGLMKTNNGIYFLEFNCRFGDPEAQVLLSLLETDFYSIALNCINNQNIENIHWKNGYATNVVLSHLSYPSEKSKTYVKINGLENLDKTVQIYTSNVKKIDNALYTNGNRVLSMVSYGHTMYQSVKNIYNNTHKIEYDSIFYRRDIGCNEMTCKMGRKLKIAIMGSTKGTSCQSLIEEIKHGNLNASIEVIITNKSTSQLLDKARTHHISCIYLPKSKNMHRCEYDKQLVDILRSYDVDVVYLIGYMDIVSKVLINEFENRIFNIHPSLLPKYTGLMNTNVHEQVIINGDKTSGCTLHHVTQNVDKGSIVLQKQCFVDTCDPNILKNKVQELENKAIVESVKILSTQPFGYKDSGVNIEKGNELVKYIKNLSKSTQKYIGGFCAEIVCNDSKWAFATDGVGTKIDIAIQTGIYDTIGIDLVAMSVNDLLTRGVRPLFFLDYIAIECVDDKTKDIVKGIHKGCEIANIQLIGGETAEMRGIYRCGKFDLAGFAMGVVEHNLSNNIQAGHYIYGIASNGVHSNGYTLIRQLLKSSNHCLLELMKPTRIYMEVLDILSNYKTAIVGIAHITGGGFENIKRLLPNTLDIALKKWEFPPIFKWIQQESGLSYTNMINTYNCGYGMALIFNKEINEPNLDLIGHIIHKCEYNKTNNNNYNLV